MSQLVAQVNSTLWRDAWFQLRLVRDPSGCRYLHTDGEAGCHLFEGPALEGRPVIRAPIGAERIFDIAAHTDPFAARTQAEALERKVASLQRRLDHARTVLEQLGTATTN